MFAPSEVSNASRVLRYRSLFRGRLSDFAVQLDTGRYARVGRALTEHELALHFLGDQTIGMYVMNERGLCWFALFDDDCLDGLEQLRTVQLRIARDGYPSYLEESRRGGHLWLFFADPVPASQVRDWFLPYCPKGVEFYPKQDEHAGKGYGSLVRLPFGIHKLTGQRYAFVRADGQCLRPVASTLFGMLDWLESIVTIPVPPDRVHPLSHQRQQMEHENKKSLTAVPSPTLIKSRGAIHAWCTQQDPFALIGSIVKLNKRGIGCCPFEGHHKYGHDRHPSFKVYAPNRPGGTCWYCYTWGRGGNVFNFLCYYYHVSAGEMWRRIQEGHVCS